MCPIDAALVWDRCCLRPESPFAVGGSAVEDDLGGTGTVFGLIGTNFNGGPPAPAAPERGGTGSSARRAFLTVSLLVSGTV